MSTRPSSVLNGRDTTQSVWAGLSLMLLGLTACAGGKVEGDTGSDPGLELEGECEVLDGEAHSVAPGAGWGSGPVCSFTDNDDLDRIYNLSDQSLKSLRVYGLETSVLPTDSVRVVVELCDPFNNPDCSYTNDYNVHSDDLTAAASGGDWVADGLGKLGNMNGFATLNRRDPHVEIQDDTRAGADPHDCGDYSPEIHVCFDWDYTTRRMAPVYSTCEAGSGRFQLVPRRRVNKDHDGNSSIALFPIQISGSGAMTSAAWVNEIEVVEDQGATLRVLKLNKAYSFSGTDQLTAPLDTVALTQTTTNFVNGVITGGAPFVIEEVPNSTTVDFVVDMEWSCGTLDDPEEVTPPAGYSFSLADLGCYGSWPQKLTIRPKPTLNPKWLEVELYGMVWGRVAPRLVQNGLEKDFAFSMSGLEVSGALLSYDSQGASIRLDEASYLGANLCDTGTYSIDPEE